MESINTVYLILGGNEGDRLVNLTKAGMAIADQIGPVLKSSPIYETASWGNEQLPAHLNQVLKIQTSYSATDVLNSILNIEKALGRVRGEKWGKRIIDIDILFYNCDIIRLPQLSIPHPQIPNRRFTLVPMAAIEPDFIHPVLGRTIAELLESTDDDLTVNRYT